MQGRALEIVGRCTKCYGDSPKAYKKEQIHPMTKVKSEYQEAYKEYHWQPRVQSMKPHEQKIASNEKSRSLLDRKTTYGIDYIYHPLPKKRVPKKYKTKANISPADQVDTTQIQDYFPKSAVVSSYPGTQDDNANVIQPSNGQPFQCDTIYNNSYPAYDVATMTASHQSPIRGKDCIAISTNQNLPTQEEDRPDSAQKSERSDKSGQSKGGKPLCTSNIDTFSKNGKFEAISTAMADFSKPEGFERPMPCPPPVHNHFSTAKFDDATTFSMAYKPFPVKPYELPIWAKKPKYKRPEGGMVLNTLYMHDFQPPNVVKPPSPIDPRTKQNKNIIIRTDAGNIKFEKTSTYKNDFQRWENVRPRETYQIIEVYQPPKEKMMFETNQRAHFKGEKADKMKPCRLISQHRELNTQSEMTFFTTYDETYRDPHPRKQASGSSTRRSCSAKQTTRASEKISRPATSGTIPKPDLSNFTISGNPISVPVLRHSSMSGDTTANNSGPNSGHVDILKIEDICTECNMMKPGCACEQKI